MSHTERSALVRLDKIEDFAREHRFETKAGLVLMSFLNGDCEHMDNPCKLCGHEERDIYAETEPGEGYES